MHDVDSLLNAWRGQPDAEGATALCKAIGALSDTAAAQRLLAEVAPHIRARQGAIVFVQLELARAAMAVGDMFLADAVLKPLLQVAPNDPQVWRLLGEVFLRAGNARDAETAFEGAIARGLRDPDTMRWHDKSRSTQAMQTTEGHAAVAAEVRRWMASLASSPRVAQASRPPPSSAAQDVSTGELTVVREVAEPDATVIREPSAEDLERLKALENAGRAGPPPGPPPPVRFPNAPSPAAQMPAAAPAAQPPPVADEASNVDFLKLPEGEKLDEVLEQLRANQGLVIEEPTAFYQMPPRSLVQSDIPPAPPAPDEQPMPRQRWSQQPPAEPLAAAPQPQPLQQQMAPAHLPPGPPRAPQPQPELASMGTIMMTAAPEGLANVPSPPLAAPPPPRVESASAIGRPMIDRVESPSGIIINPRAGGAPTNDSDDGFGSAKTIPQQSYVMPEPSPAQALAHGQMPANLAPVGAAGVESVVNPTASTVRPPKMGGTSKSLMAAIVFVALAVLASTAWYVFMVRGVRFGALGASSTPLAELALAAEHRTSSFVVAV